MKIDIIDKTGKKVADYDLKLSSDIREDIFKKAVMAESSLFRQPYGASVSAGRRHSINVSKRRQTFRTTYGKGVSRTPRKTMWRRGMQVRFVGAFSPNTVGGRRAHPPKACKIIQKNINNKEWLKALQIGLLASVNKSIVLKNGQRVPEKYPFILNDDVETIDRTKDFRAFLNSIGFESEIERLSKKVVRAGKGTMRNRTYKQKRGPLVVVSSYDSPLLKSSKNIQGFEVITPDLLMVRDFAMSSKAGRAVLFTQKAIKEFEEGLK